MTKDSRNPPQWQEGKPGWGFDRWSVARGGKSYEPEIAGPAYGADRAVAYAGGIIAIALLVAATFMESTGLALGGLAIIVVTVVARRVIKFARRSKA
jgi:uncharacterized membrane protein